VAAVPLASWGGIEPVISPAAYVRAVYACWAARHEATVAAWYDRWVVGG